MYQWMSKPDGSRVWTHASTVGHWEALGFRVETPVETVDQKQQPGQVDTVDGPGQEPPLDQTDTDGGPDMSTDVDTGLGDGIGVDASR